MQVSSVGAAGATARVAEIRDQIALLGGGAFAARLAAAAAPTPARTPAAPPAGVTAPPAAAGSSAAFDLMASRPAALSGGGAAVGAASAGAVSGPSDPAAAMARLRAFGNGRIPRAELVEIGVGNHRLAAPAAEAFRRMRAAAQAEGVKIGVTDSYRDFDAQVDVARRKGLYSQGGLAAKPGTSDHGWGMALDLRLDPAAQAWMRAHGPSFGFHEDTPREPWHWGYKA